MVGFNTSSRGRRRASFCYEAWRAPEVRPETSGGARDVLEMSALDVVENSASGHERSVDVL